MTKRTEKGPEPRFALSVSDYGVQIWDESTTYDDACLRVFGNFASVNQKIEFARECLALLNRVEGSAADPAKRTEKGPSFPRGYSEAVYGDNRLSRRRGVEGSAAAPERTEKGPGWFEFDAQGRMDDEEVCRRLGVEGSAADLPAPEPLREALAELVEVARRVPSFADDDGLDEAIEKADRALAHPTESDSESPLREALQHILGVMGPKPAPCCRGCEYEWNEVLKIARRALGKPA